MNIPILYLNCLILASTIHPSGFSYSLYTFRKGAPQRITTEFLAFLALPYLVVVLAVWALQPAMLSLRGSTFSFFAAAVLTAPAALLLEYFVHALASYRAGGRLFRGLTVQPFWGQRLSATDQLLLGLVVVGEEIFYRVIWLGTLTHSFGLPVPAALFISSLAYGLNHLAFGATSVVSKTLTGVLYGCLYLLGGESVWLPVIAHGLQNALLFALTNKRHE